MSLGRKGPGLLVRDLAKGVDPQIDAVVGVITTVRPDILLLNDFDYDYGQVALDLFAKQIAKNDLSYPYRYSSRPNAGMATGLDMNGDGRFGGPADAQGFGGFSGRQGMAILSRFPIDVPMVRDFSALLWKDLPGAILPMQDGKLFPSEQATDIQRLSSKGLWDVPVILPDGRVLHLLASHATPPVFDGPEDQNGKRNRDEIRFWTLYLDGMKVLDYPTRSADLFVIIGDFNADPKDGEGARTQINALLHHKLVQDPQPSSLGAIVAARDQGKGNLTQLGDPALDTVDWNENRTPGNMRVDYVLPSVGLKIIGAGVFWPAPDESGFEFLGSSGDLASHHRLVWVDVQ